MSDITREKADDYTHAAAKAGHQAIDAAEDKVNAATNRVADVYQQGLKQAGNLQDSAEEYIQEKPFKSVLIAAGVGLLLGCWLSSRSKRD